MQEGFLSQPIALRPPATPAAVRRLLRDRWRLPERAADGDSYARFARFEPEFLFEEGIGSPGRRSIARAVVAPVELPDGRWLLAESVGPGRLVFDPERDDYVLVAGDGPERRFGELDDLAEALEPPGAADATLAFAVAEAARRHGFPGKGDDLPAWAAWFVARLDAEFVGPPREIVLGFDRGPDGAIAVAGELTDVAGTWVVVGDALPDPRGGFFGPLQIVSPEDARRLDEATEREAARVGFRFTDDDSGRGRLVGSRAALERFVAALRAAAETLGPEPPGAIPRELELAVPPMRLVLVRDGAVSLADGVLAAPNDAFFDLAERVGGWLDEASPGDERAFALRGRGGASLTIALDERAV